MQIDASIGHAREIVRQNDADQQRSVHVNHGPQDERERQDAVSAAPKTDSGNDSATRDNQQDQRQGARVDIRV